MRCILCPRLAAYIYLPTGQENMSYRLCVLVSCLLVCPAPCLTQTSIQPSACSLRIMIVDQNSPTNCKLANSSDTFNCTLDQLGSALDNVATADNFNETDLVCITLTSGKLLLNYTDTQIDRNIHIIGHEDNDTTVMCSPNATFDADVYEEFPLKFGGNGSVYIERVHFADCKRPLLFNNVANVTITDCYFRYTLMCTYIYVSLSLYHSLPPPSLSVVLHKRHLKSLTLSLSLSCILSSLTISVRDREH